VTRIQRQRRSATLAAAGVPQASAIAAITASARTAHGVPADFVGETPGSVGGRATGSLELDGLRLDAGVFALEPGGWSAVPAGRPGTWFGVLAEGPGDKTEFM
jgi:hypothetical protein